MNPAAIELEARAKRPTRIPKSLITRKCEARLFGSRS
jgi:hypothetical protein